jgi:hypothetical protein
LIAKGNEMKLFLELSPEKQYWIERGNLLQVNVFLKSEIYFLYSILCSGIMFGYDNESAFVQRRL